MYLNQYWKDERLSFSPEEDKVLTLSGDFAEKIWVPDTFFANDKNRCVNCYYDLKMIIMMTTILYLSSFLHDVTEQNKMVRLHGDGAITYGMRFTTTLACMMDLHYYPLDSQNCTVEIESCKCYYSCPEIDHLNAQLKLLLADGYTVSDVVMYWREEPVVGVEDAELPQFTIVGYETNERKIKLATGNLGNRCLFPQKVMILMSYRYLPKAKPFVQTPAQHWLFCVPNISPVNSYCHAVLGFVLD